MSEFWFSVLALIAFTASMLALFNNVAVVKRYTVTSAKIKGGLRIVVIADLHGKKYNPLNTYITDKVKACNPDIIIIAGDYVDYARTDYTVCYRTLETLRTIADVYYVSGNHEAFLGLDNVLECLECKDILIDGEYRIFKDYSILGIPDIDTLESDTRDDTVSLFEGLSNYKIAVCHRPFEFTNGLDLSSRDIDLVISGHEHGGVIRIPFFGAVATHDGIFPEISKGKYEKNGTTLIVSGGLGNTFLPLRIANFPEIVQIDIKEK